MSTASVFGAAQVLGTALDAAHQMIEATMADVDDDLANRPTPGQANRLGSSYAHMVLAENAVVAGMFQDTPPLFAGAWAERTGTDRPVVISGAPFPGVEAGDLGAWYHEVRVDLDACRAYALAVYAASAAFIRAADAAALARPIDLSLIGVGTMPVAIAFAVFVTGHVNNVCGEISAVKGTFGLQGYPV